MAVTTDSFRVDFPEFCDASKFSNQQLDFWLNCAILTLTPAQSAWDMLFDLGTELLAAHHIAIECRDIETAIKGGIPGQSAGPQISKSVGGVSVSYGDAAKIEGGGAYNNTTYGTRFLQMAQMIGAGGLQF